MQLNKAVVSKISLVLMLAFLFGPQTLLAKSDNANIQENHARVCPGPASKDSAACHARIIVDNNGAPKAATAPSGYGPAQFRGAYNLSGLAPKKQIIAIVDAYDHPSILSDLNVYSTQMNLPLMSSCPVATATVSAPCFQKVDQNGGTAYPQVNAGWALEIALDVEVAHAICENCSILLVEAASNSFADLMAAVDRAAAMGATEISNSYGASEFSSETLYDFHFNLPGRAVTVSSGDAGFGVEYPAASANVTAVGGTSLTLNANNSYNNEKVWNGAGSGCSLYENTNPLGQTDPCTKRTVADVSAVADPNTGAAVYDSVRYQGKRGWFKVGGTSLSAPLIAGVYALAGGVPAGVAGNSVPYASSNTNFHDVTSGSNGSCGTYLCTGTVGYDGPTGLGSPNGTGGF